MREQWAGCSAPVFYSPKDRIRCSASSWPGLSPWIQGFATCVPNAVHDLRTIICRFNSQLLWKSWGDIDSGKPHGALAGGAFFFALICGLWWVARSISGISWNTPLWEIPPLFRNIWAKILAFLRTPPLFRNTKQQGGDSSRNSTDNLQ